jgi:hypothetical protein
MENFIKNFDFYSKEYLSNMSQMLENDKINSKYD